MVDIQLIQIGNEHWVEIHMDSGTIRRGAFATAIEAEAAAAGFASRCRTLFPNEVRFGAVTTAAPHNTNGGANSAPK